MAEGNEVFEADAKLLADLLDGLFLGFAGNFNV
ncbi:MAG: Uncharacterised protein [Rhodospirillaceae bacterium]|nr:MAG: Uncharacterised protein [Rhodospirillaceae bacterium]